MRKYILFMIIGILLGTGVFYSVALFLPFQMPPSNYSTLFLDKNGEIIGEAIYSGSIRHQEILSDEIPDFYKKSLIALEDKTFYTNNGVSIRGILRSSLHNIQAGKVVEGGTTLSSGLIRNIFWIGEERSSAKKVLEFLYAIRLNYIYSKEQILTEYINRVSFGYMNYGLRSAARYYLKQEPKNLTKAEQIALLILPKDSKKYDPYKKPKNFRMRFEAVTETLAKEKIITTEEQKEILGESINWNVEHNNTLPYVTDFLSQIGKHRIGTGVIQTTFDETITKEIDRVAKNTLNELAWKNVGDYGIVIAERNQEKNPLLRVMIGGNNYSESVAGQVNTTLALRQPGSTIKPFTYALAFEKFGFTPETTILDLPTAFKTSEDYSYEPKNYSQSYKGEISLRQALSESVNIPAIKLAQQVGVDTLLKFLQGLGITSLTKDADHYGLGITLGNGEISLLELLQAYTIFTNNGKYCPFQIIEHTQAPICGIKIDQKYTKMVTSILSDRYAKIGDFALNSALDFPDRDVAVKTGTSRNFRDNWAVGFTDTYMIGVWTGNKSGENMKGVSGATGAGEIFRRIVYTLEKKEQSQTPKKVQKQGKSYLSITNPLRGSLYKKEQTGDMEKQRIQLRFETNIQHHTAYWQLDGNKLKSDFIEVTPGNHDLEIILMQNNAIIAKDIVHFQVQ